MEKSRLRRCRRSSMVALRLPTNSWPQTLPRRASGLGRAHFDRLCRNRVPHHAAQMLERGHRLPGSEVTSASDCLNGSLVYLPALAAMAVVEGLLAERKHPATPLILWAALIFAVSVTFGSLDLAMCASHPI